MKTIHYPNKIRSHLVTIVPMAPFTPKLIELYTIHGTCVNSRKLVPEQLNSRK